MDHKDRSWCVLPDGHEGRCLADWEKAMHDKNKSMENYRGRRYYACRAMQDIEQIIDKLGIEDGSTLPIPDQEFKPIPSEQIRDELKNQARVLLRTILIFNDGSVHKSKLT